MYVICCNYYKENGDLVNEILGVCETKKRAISYIKNYRPHYGKEINNIEFYEKEGYKSYEAYIPGDHPAYDFRSYKQRYLIWYEKVKRIK